jgi:hypothetical protein
MFRKSTDEDASAEGWSAAPVRSGRSHAVPQPRASTWGPGRPECQTTAREPDLPSQHTIRRLYEGAAILDWRDLDVFARGESNIALVFLVSARRKRQQHEAMARS